MKRRERRRRPRQETKEERKHVRDIAGTEINMESVLKKIIVIKVAQGHPVCETSFSGFRLARDRLAAPAR